MENLEIISTPDILKIKENDLINCNCCGNLLIKQIKQRRGKQIGEDCGFCNYETRPFGNLGNSKYNYGNGCHCNYEMENYLSISCNFCMDNICRACGINNAYCSNNNCNFKICDYCKVSILCKNPKCPTCKMNSHKKCLSENCSLSYCETCEKFPKKRQKRQK